MLLTDRGATKTRLFIRCAVFSPPTTARNNEPFYNSRFFPSSSSPPTKMCTRWRPHKKLRLEFNNLIIFHIRYLLTTMTNFTNFVRCTKYFVSIIWPELMHNATRKNGRAQKRSVYFGTRRFGYGQPVNVTIYFDWHSIFREAKRKKRRAFYCNQEKNVPMMERRDKKTWTILTQLVPTNGFHRTSSWKSNTMQQIRRNCSPIEYSL